MVGRWWKSFSNRPSTSQLRYRKRGPCRPRKHLQRFPGPVHIDPMSVAFCTSWLDKHLRVNSRLLHLLNIRSQAVGGVREGKEGRGGRKGWEGGGREKYHCRRVRVIHVLGN